MSVPVKFGKLAPKHDYTTPRFAVYATDELPSPPAEYDVLPRVFSAVHNSDISYLFPLDGNSQYGDCTIAALCHAQTIYRGMDGSLCIWGEKDAVALYFQLTGGQDTGLVELDVLNFWKTHPINHDRILGYASVNPKNHTHVMQAIHLFGGVYIGFQVTSQTIAQFEAHQPWTAAPLINEGHAVYIPSYTQTGGTALTWGALQEWTWGWWDECVDECYSILPPEAFSPKFQPGFSFADLQKDLQALRG